jgi:hypothetical protein
MKGFLRAVVIFATATFLAVGCGDTGGGTARVKGKVTVAGLPVEGIAVTFTPTSGRPAVGVTDASGNFTLSTLNNADGAVPGTHKVAFSKGPSGDPPPSDLTGPPPPAQPFNAKYTSGATSGITAEVVKGKSNEFTWDLEK